MYEGTSIEGHGGFYRYALSRRWAPVKFTNSPDTVVFCMLNPSTANVEEDDPTLRRCVGFAKLWGYNALRVVNLYAMRTASPKHLARCEHSANVYGLDNMVYLDKATRHANTDRVVLAWGGNVLDAIYPRAVGFVLSGNAPSYVLGWTKSGQPRHPLYLAKNSPLARCDPQDIGVARK